MKTYYLTDTTGGEETIHAEDMDAACKAAREWVTDDGYCWDDGEGTVWVDVRVQESGDDDNAAWVTVALDPPEPACCDDGQDHCWESPHWLLGGCKENPGVQGHGGGVVIHEACMRCGCSRITDTWAQRPDTGEEGLTSVEYHSEEYWEKLQEEAEKDGRQLGQHIARLKIQDDLDDLLPEGIDVLPEIVDENSASMGDFQVFETDAAVSAYDELVAPHNAWIAARSEGVRYMWARIHAHGDAHEFLGTSWEEFNYSVDEDGNPTHDYRGNTVADYVVEELDPHDNRHHEMVLEWYG